MSLRSRAAVRVWRTRNARMVGDRGYLAYLVVMVTLVVAAPLARAVWLSVATADGVALLASRDAPDVTGVGVAALWAGALLLGGRRGPVLRAPFLTYALATSDLRRSDAFRGPLLRAGAVATSSTTVIAGVVGSSLLAHDLADPLAVLGFTAAGVMVGVISTVAWLTGQVFPRVAIPVALGIMALGAAGVAVPEMRTFTPWGWVALAYPGGHAPTALAALCATVVALVAAVPMMMNRLSHAQLAAQAARWDSATIHAAGMDFSTAAAVYRPRPHLGRRVRAVRPAGWQPATFVMRDAIGAARTPGRLIVGILSLVCAAVFLTLAFAPGAPGLVLGATAGVVLFAGLGPVTDGLRHAVYVASDYSLYGISDEHLLLNHLLFPLVMAVVVVTVAAWICATAAAIGLIPPVLGSLALVLRPCSRGSETP
ncbi:hypothetical protein NQ156_06985 [Microbacterium sp. zg.Y625]|uniref:hypothetical protein n=1 Tax=Microbacterium jiangjiandongii TaxID=3049071 RepID=UPI00214CABEE|nr:MULTISPECIES: hypothetical protein [unclassified Microbacterium]MCR2792805.1 hypothetical protein [Microbacterium sp. zg.Y625]WIM26780.1 hypothetical protein QNO14_07010 [Microbacterium sp. zg-Y625]